MEEAPSDNSVSNNQEDAVTNNKDEVITNSQDEESDNSGGGESEHRGMGIMNEPMIAPVISPNDVLSASIVVVDDNSQQIIITEQDDGQQIYASAVYPYPLENLTWSTDSTKLQFDSKVSDSVTNHITIDIEKKTETLNK